MYAEVERQRDVYYTDILAKMRKYDAGLVDNENYLYWALSTPNEETVGELLLLDPQSEESDETQRFERFEETEWIAKYFLSSEGAQPIETKEELSLALDTMFYYRAQLGLEVERIYRQLDWIGYAFGSLDGCTEETREAGYLIQGYISDGSVDDFDLKEWLYNATSEWFDQTYE